VTRTSGVMSRSCSTSVRTGGSRCAGPMRQCWLVQVSLPRLGVRRVGQAARCTLEKEMYGDWTSPGTACGRPGWRCAPGSCSPLRYLRRDSGRLAGDAAGTSTRSHQDRIPLGPPMRFQVRANWKTFMDQGAGDNYHPLSLHRSLQEVGMTADLPGSPGSRPRSGARISHREHPRGQHHVRLPAGFP